MTLLELLAKAFIAGRCATADSEFGLFVHEHQQHINAQTAVAAGCCTAACQRRAGHVCTCSRNVSDGHKAFLHVPVHYCPTCNEWWKS